MRALRRLIAFAAALPLLAPAHPAHAQSDRYANSETAPREREAKEMARVRPLIEAERLRPRLAGTWQVEKTVAALMTGEGKLPPMNAASRRLYNQRVAARKAGRSGDPVELCLPPGTPRSLFIAAPFIITQTPVKVTFFQQYQHLVRHVYLDGPLKTEDLDPLWQGTSSGRWEGDTLVVETSGFNGELWLDQAGLPQSEHMLVTERFRLIDAGTLEDAITIDDRATYTAPWNTRVRFRRLPDDTLFDDDRCNDKFLEVPLKEVTAMPQGGAPPP